MHVESIAIFAAAVILVGLLYRRLAGATMAARLAVLMYAIDDAHCMDVAWIANRNAALAAALGFGVVLLYDHAVRGGSRRARILAPLLFAVALLAGETALGTLGYLAAHALWLEDGSRGRRAWTLAPYALITLAWGAVYRALDYGAAGSALYVDPGRDPLSFLTGLVSNLPVLLYGQFGFPPADLWIMVQDHVKPIVVAAVAAAVLIGAYGLAIGVLRTNENAFYATGMILALVPAYATVPSDRLPVFSGFGAFGLIADFLTAPRDHLHGFRRIVVRSSAVIFVLVHIVLAPLLLPIRAVQTLRMMNAPVERSDESLPSELSGKQLVVVSAPDAYSTAYSLCFRQVRGAPVPEALRLLAVVVRGKLKLRRTGERTLELTQSQGFFHEPFTTMFRAEGHPLGLGERVHVSGMTATVKEFAVSDECKRPLRSVENRPSSSPRRSPVSRSRLRGGQRAAPPAASHR